MQSEFLALLEKLRVLYGKPFSPNSAYRCEKHNSKVGGAKTSWHLQGRAADIPVGSPQDRHTLLRCATQLGLCALIYRTFVHVDNRPGIPLVLVEGEF